MNRSGSQGSCVRGANGTVVCMYPGYGRYTFLVKLLPCYFGSFTRNQVKAELTN
jgi:hypothetical protein